MSLCNTEVTFKGILVRQTASSFVRCFPVKTFKAYLVSILLVRLDGILACLSEEEKLSPFVKLEGFLTCLFTLTEWWPQSRPSARVGGGLGGRRASQTAVKADLGGRASAAQPGSQCLGAAGTRAGASAVGTQAVWVAAAGSSAPVSCVVLGAGGGSR